MWSRTLRFVALLSLALLLILAGAWLWSYVYGSPDAWTEQHQYSADNHPPFHWVRYWKSGRDTHFLVSTRGILGVVRYRTIPWERASPEPVVVAPGLWRAGGAIVILGRPRLTFGYAASGRGAVVNGFQMSHQSFALPFWLLCLPTLVAPPLWLLARRRARVAVRQNRCVTCGYDLRASPDRCPECGTPRPQTPSPRQTSPADVRI